MKKMRLFFFLILFFALISFLLINTFFSRKPIISSPYKVLEVKRTLTANGYTADIEKGNGIAILCVYFNGKDVTNKINTNKLIEVLSTSMCRRTLGGGYFPYNQSDVTWEIYFHYNEVPMHVLLGKINIYYGKGVYEILDPDTIKHLLEQMNS